MRRSSPHRLLRPEFLTGVYQLAKDSSGNWYKSVLGPGYSTAWLSAKYHMTNSLQSKEWYHISIARWSKQYLILEVEIKPMIGLWFRDPRGNATGSHTGLEERRRLHCRYHHFWRHESRDIAGVFLAEKSCADAMEMSKSWFGRGVKLGRP